MRIVFTCIMLLAYFTISYGSDPGQPLDCSDWVILEPGYSCGVYRTFSTQEDDSIFLWAGNGMATNGEGALLTVRFIKTQHETDFWDQWHRLEVVLHDGTTETVIATVESRVMPTEERRDHIRNHRTFGESPETTEANFTYDYNNGSLLIPLRSYCAGPACPGDYGGGWWIAQVEGFSTTFEILQTYDAANAEIGFRTPYMPEGMQAADWFDTYWGHISTVGDWSQAQPLQCAYPLTPPSVGDYLSVPDTLPTPSPGSGYYYITAATYLGETRYGRQGHQGVLSGRDPAQLPACVNQ